MTTNLHPLGPFIRRFLLEEVVAERNLSLNTQRSYRDTFRLLFGFISRQVPELIEQVTTIHAIPSRRTGVPTMSYLDKPEMDALLAVPDRQRSQGRRDYALLLFLYNTGARASEAAAVKVADLALDASPSVRLLGKGRKIRLCPLWAHTVDLLGKTLATHIKAPKDAPVFLNVRGQPLTRYGIHNLVARTAKKAAATTPSLQSKGVSPHTIRHTTAVHLLHAGVDINTIRAWLGHVSLETTNRYAEIDLEMKAAALEACAVRDPATHDEDRTPIWRKDNRIMEFLEAL